MARNTKAKRKARQATVTEPLLAVVASGLAADKFARKFSLSRPKSRQEVRKPSYRIIYDFTVDGLNERGYVKGVAIVPKRLRGPESRQSRLNPIRLTIGNQTFLLLRSSLAAGNLLGLANYGFRYRQNVLVCGKVRNYWGGNVATLDLAGLLLAYPTLRELL